MSVFAGIARRESDQKTIHLQGLTCANCAAKIEKQVKQLDGVIDAQINLVNQTLEVEVLTSIGEEIVEHVQEIVVRLEPHVKVYQSKDLSQAEGEEGIGKELIQLGIGAGVFGAAIVFSLPFPIGLGLFLVSYFIIGGEVLLRAGRNILRGEIFDENFLMTIATVGAFAIGEYPEGVAVMLFYQVGELFQGLAVNRSRRSIRALMDIRPDFANRLLDGRLIQVDPQAVRVGDQIVVKPGERIPLDGVVLEGQSMVDTSALTGESVPRSARAGDEILAGCINISGLIKLEVTKTFGESTVAKILDMVQNASSRKAPTEAFITRFARYYTPVVVFSALAIAVLPPLVVPGAAFADWLYRGLIFLVISCPCALVISIPLGFFGGIGGASRHGILIKGGNYLEALHEVKTVVFDKTGTLTRGVFKVAQVIPVDGISKAKLLQTAALAEVHSNHPIARSIREAYGQAIVAGPGESYEEIPGQGIKAVLRDRMILAGNEALMRAYSVAVQPADVVGTVVHVAVNGQYYGLIVIRDEMKADAAEAVEKLRRLGIRELVMLTGDRKEIAEKVAEELKLDRVYAGLLPDEKVAKVEEMVQSNGRSGKIAFVGDGMNDAPVLARADVGMAMGGLGSDAAIEAADIVLMTDEPSKIADAIRIARKTRTIVVQNIVFALGVKGMVLLLGAFGEATMWEAVFADVGVALIAVLNAMRAMNIEGKKRPLRV